MSQEMPKQLIVPFGKYQGKPIEVLLQDKEYAKWLSAQGWFKDKFQNIYTIIVNNYYPVQPDSAEHNQMQIKFLNDDCCLKIACHISGDKLFQYNGTHFLENVPPLLKGAMAKGSDMKEVIEQIKKKNGSNLLRISERKYEQDGVDVKYDITYGYSELWATDSMYYRYKDFFDAFWKFSVNYKFNIELKPTVGDDFPSVLRQINKNKSNILLVREYTGSGASWDEVKLFFQSQNIKVITEAEIEDVNLPEYETKILFDEAILGAT